MPGSSKAVTHHCPMRDSGNGKCIKGQTPMGRPYCKKHQYYCPEHTTWTFLKTESCPKCK
ncbi:hypothetical protein K470DRAFT_257962 [Piedraia hortae CBS 480.64]|uniref:Uncharacterized protein n=1 Tax=Piedraia hortae CBS 480.64 TaxID=1314780 RepID=A0A6A7BZ86_9PEZI|nr:hypothetical protein K470DRAFT_257962 [Piedraia hortae CBS 480.64]